MRRGFPFPVDGRYGIRGSWVFLVFFQNSTDVADVNGSSCFEQDAVGIVAEPEGDGAF